MKERKPQVLSKARLDALLKEIKAVQGTAEYKNDQRILKQAENKIKKNLLHITEKDRFKALSPEEQVNEKQTKKRKLEDTKLKKIEDRFKKCTTQKQYEFKS
jgi:hypothetical protein